MTESDDGGLTGHFLKRVEFLLDRRKVFGDLAPVAAPQYESSLHKNSATFVSLDMTPLHPIVRNILAHDAVYEDSLRRLQSGFRYVNPETLKATLQHVEDSNVTLDDNPRYSAKGALMEWASMRIAHLGNFEGRLTPTYAFKTAPIERLSEQALKRTKYLIEDFFSPFHAESFTKTLEKNISYDRALAASVLLTKQCVSELDYSQGSFAGDRRRRVLGGMQTGLAREFQESLWRSLNVDQAVSGTVAELSVWSYPLAAPVMNSIQARPVSRKGMGPAL